MRKQEYNVCQIPGFKGFRPGRIVLLWLVIQLFLVHGKAQLVHTGEFFLEQPKNNVGVDVIENLEGDIVIVGSCDVKDKGADILIQVLTKKGTIRNSFKIGGLKDDVGRSIIETKDGGYIIAGYTESVWAESKGGKDAILMKINRQGKVLWHHISGTSGDDEWKKVMFLSNGNILAAGYVQSHPSAISMTISGVPQWEQTWPQIVAVINSACIAENQLFFAGTSTLGVNTRLFLQRCNLDGRILHTRYFDQFEEGTSIISLKDGNIAVAGNILTTSARIDGFVLKLNSELEIINQLVLGGRSDDGISSITELESTELVVTGFSFSASKGARRPDLWIEMLDKNLSIIPLHNTYMGGSQEEFGLAVLELTNKSVWVLGSSFTGLTSGVDPWVIQFNPSSSDAADLQEGSVEFFPDDSIWISGEDRILDNDEYGFVTLNLKNISDNYSTKNKIFVHSSDPSLITPDSLVYKSIAPGETAILTLPFSLGEVLTQEKIKITLTGSDNHQIIIPIPARTIYVPEIQFVEHSFIKDEKAGDITLKIKANNKGKGFLSQGSIYFITDFKIKPLSGDVILVNNLGPSANAELEYKFQPENNYNQDSIQIQVVFRSDESTILAEEMYIYVLDKKEEPLPDSLISPIVTDLSKPIVFQTAIWLRPDPEENGYKIEHQIPEIDIRLKIISSVPLVTDSISLFINDLLAEPGIVFLPESKSLTQDLSASGYQYTYRNKINLLLGQNLIKVVNRSSGVPITEVPLIVDYIPKRYNLHLISIGVPHDDLQFTSKDAGDLVNAFQGQSGKLFKEVIIHLFNTPDNTTTSALRFAIQDIANDYFLREKIQPGDMILLYVSSHGFQLDESKDKFRIAASDFNWLYKPQTSLDFKDDIIDVLSSLPCKKLILLDACYSGAIANIISEDGQKGVIDPGEISLSKAIARLVEAQNDFQVITSSSPGQRSYEDPLWGNSAFMKGILEAIGQAQSLDSKQIADKDGDRILYLSEIYNYIEIRIPEIVLTKKPRPEDIQKPWMMAREEWPIFVY